jgi:hypothetical protein
MDEREWRDGRVVVEVSAKGRGVIPAHPQMFDFTQPGFDCEVSDNGLSITEFVSDGKSLSAQADRNWQFTYRRKKDLRGDVTLHFPALTGEVTPKTTEYKHYEDADLVALDAAKVSAGVRLKNRGSTGLRVGVITAVALGLGVVGLVWSRRKRSTVTAGEAVLALPALITPFSVVAFLRRIQKDCAAKLDDVARQSLQAQIREIEAAFFSGGTQPAQTPDLEAVARKWHQAAA